MHWILLAFANAFGFSIVNALSKKAAQGQSRFVVAFCSSLVASIVLFIIALFRGFPVISQSFWIVAIVTTIINVIAFPLLLRGYELGELSAVFSMLLLTPLFMTITSWFILGEHLSIRAFVGMLITILGLFIIARASMRQASVSVDNRKGMLYGLGASLLYSVSANFDKLVVMRSDAVFGPATVLALISVGLVPFLVASRSKSTESGTRSFKDLKIPVLMGLVIAVDMILFYTALQYGLATYTMLIKRTSIIFGILWGYIFFKERNLASKCIGTLIAVAGLALVLIAG